VFLFVYLFLLFSDIVKHTENRLSSPEVCF